MTKIASPAGAFRSGSRQQSVGATIRHFDQHQEWTIHALRYDNGASAKLDLRDYGDDQSLIVFWII